ncbi:plasmid partition protein ParG [Acinetobacter sp. ABJ_C5_2]|uniref:plasmid partition protein ParG n=1 Tax=Acinetobacter sp. ABJ_C5_2 TaxID=3376992 RepID=UPI0037C82640
MTRHDKQMNIRMAHETVNELKEAAKKNRRSVTAQLNQIIEDWLREQKQQGAKA